MPTENTASTTPIWIWTTPYYWKNSTVRDILSNKTYFGHTVNLKSTTISHKNKKELHRPESEQVIVENTHEAIISQALWDEDHVLERVTAEQFRMLSNDYNTEQKELEGTIPECEARLEKLKVSVANVDAFIEKARHYTQIDEPTPELVWTARCPQTTCNHNTQSR